MRVCIVIPAYEPGGEFVPYAQEVLAAGLGPVLVVDDGSGPAYAPVFAALAEMGCTVLTHEQNRGKGAALKTALRWYGAHEDGCAGIVTADCDGQHTVKDVRRVCEAMEACPGTLVLGCRDFGPGTPARSATGNRVTSAAMRVLYNIDLKDTQTGLRGIPNGMHGDLLEVRGERYEYELNMLIYAKQRSIPYTIVPIETVYFNNNEGSHYRTVADSARIIHQLGSGLVQYAMSAGLSVVVDVFVYCVLVKWLLLGLPLAPRLFFAAVIARTLSSVVNYTCNRRLPYVQNKKIGPTVAKYYCLWLAQLMLSFVGVWAACTGLHMDDMLAKLLVDALLAVASYQVQLRWVFSEKTPRPVLYGSGEAMAAKRTTAQGGFSQRNAAPDFARQTQKAGPVTGQRGFAAGEMEAEADKCPQHAAGREDGGRGAALLNKKKIYGPLARFLRAGVRPFLHRWDTSGAQKAQPPAVYVVHHRNMSGPVHTLALLPDEPRPWVLHVFLDRHECFAQYYGYTFRKRFGWPAPAAWAAAGVLSLTVPAVVRSFGAIPVYRSLKETRDMMEQARRRCCAMSIMLCPDVAYDSAAPATGEIYKGFLQLEKLYHAGTGAHLRFVPVYCGKTKRIVTGEPVCFSDGAPFRTQREEVAGRIVDGLNALAAACGELEREAAEKS
ncbi:MAG: GtrA family protein [Ruthenibacterium lactatiformans]